MNIGVIGLGKMGRIIAKKLSILHSLPLKNIIKITSNNVNNLFKLN